MSILHTQVTSRTCELNSCQAPTWNPLYRHRHAGQHQGCLLPQDCVSYTPLLPILDTEHREANTWALGHPKYSFPGSKEPLVLPPDVCESSLLPATRTLQHIPHMLFPVYSVPSHQNQLLSLTVFCLVQRGSLVQSHSFPLLLVWPSLGWRHALLSLCL